MMLDTEKQLMNQISRLQRVESGELGSMRLCELATRRTIACVYWQADNANLFNQEVNLLHQTVIEKGLLNPENTYYELTMGNLATARIGLIEKELARRALNGL